MLAVNSSTVYGAQLLPQCFTATNITYVSIHIRVPTLSSLTACLPRCDIWSLPAAQAQLHLVGVWSRMLALRLPNQFCITTAACVVWEVKLGAAFVCRTKQLRRHALDRRE